MTDKAPQKTGGCQVLGGTEEAWGVGGCGEPIGLMVASQKKCHSSDFFLPKIFR